MFDQMETQVSAEPQLDFDTFYKDDFLLLISFLIRLGASQAEAEDAAQEAMKSALITWSNVRNPKAYVRRAAKGAFFRSRNTDRDRPGREFKAASIEQEVAAVVAFDGETRDVMNLVRALPPAQREVMAWTIDGYEPAEIAELIGKNPATVRTNLGHARKTLLEKIQQEDNTTTRKEGSDGP